MVEKDSFTPEALAPQADDLEAIHGIGKAIARCLVGAGICTYAQLAATTHEDLYGLVQGSRPGLSLKKLVEEDWPGQARALMDPAVPEKGAAPADGQHSVSFVIELLLEADNRVRRTTITHTGSDDKLTVPGWDAGQVLDLMARHAELRSAAAEPAAEPAAPEPAAEPAVPAAPVARAAPPTLAVEAAVAHEPGGTTWSGIIPAGRDWVIDVEWTLSGVQADVLDEEWLIEVYLESMGPGSEYTVPAGGPARKSLHEYDWADPAAETYRYAHGIDVPAGAVTPGRYLVVPAICPADPAGKLGSLTGFGTGRMLYLAEW